MAEKYGLKIIQMIKVLRFILVYQKITDQLRHLNLGEEMVERIERR
jgi:hypothetical protein